MKLGSRLLPLTLAAAALGLALPVRAADIVDNWSQVQAPPAPKLENVTIDPKTTALLMLDFLQQNCSHTPECMATLPAMQALLNTARQKNMLVVYTMFPGTKATDIMPPVAPTGKEPMVAASLDKFLKTNLDDVLQKNNIKTVIVVGSASNGAVLFTGTSAFLRGYNVVVPVDGMSAPSPYADLTTVNTFATAPTMGGKAHLTRSTMLRW